MSTSTARPLPPPALSPEQRALEADAAALDQLRREVAEAGAKGIKPSRAKLAEFARLQRNYIDRKMALRDPKRVPAFAPKPSSPSFEKLTKAVPEFGKHAGLASHGRKATPAQTPSESDAPETLVPGKVEVIRADGSTADSNAHRFKSLNSRISILRLVIWLILLGAAGYAAWMHWNGKL